MAKVSAHALVSLTSWHINVSIKFNFTVNTMETFNCTLANISDSKHLTNIKKIARNNIGAFYTLGYPHSLLLLKQQMELNQPPGYTIHFGSLEA